MTRERTDVVTVALLLVGATQLLTGVWLMVDPGSFYDAIATYPPRNDHFLRDIGSWNVALGLAALIAWRRPSWRVPMLGVLTVNYGLHAVSHLINVDDAEPESLGVVNLVLLAGATVLLAALFAREARK
jgi:predicted anti-sigma-YlaC factor YlaD